MGWLGDVFDDVVGTVTGSKQAGKAAEKASKQQMAAYDEAAAIQGGYQDQAMQTLQGEYATSDPIRQGAISQYGGLYGLPGGTGSQQDLIDYARESPIYGAIMQTQQAGEDAILRNAAATGGLRSGNTNANLYQYNQQLEADALAQAYGEQMRGLENILTWGSGAAPIASQQNLQGATQANWTSGIGETQAQGTIAEAQALQDGYGMLYDTGATVAGAII